MATRPKHSRLVIEAVEFAVHKPKRYKIYRADKGVNTTFREFPVSFAKRKNAVLVLKLIRPLIEAEIVREEHEGREFLESLQARR